VIASRARRSTLPSLLAATAFAAMLAAIALAASAPAFARARAQRAHAGSHPQRAARVGQTPSRGLAATPYMG
jgi:hypothetical protein